MNRILICLLFLIFTGAAVQAGELEEVRKAFYRASMEQKVCEEIYNKIKDKDYSHNAVLLGYQGVYEAIMAKYTWNPFSKWWYFRNGVENLEEAIGKDPENIELIFLRFSVQTNCPSFLGYDQNIATDKAFIMRMISDENVRSKYSLFIGDIIKYLLGCDFVTRAEKDFLKEINA